MARKLRKRSTHEWEKIRHHSGGRKLKDWIHEERAKILCESRKLNIFKTKVIFDEKFGEDEALEAEFIASNG